MAASDNPNNAADASADPTVDDASTPDDAIVDAEVVPTGAASATPASASTPVPPPDYNDAGVPSFDFVRDKIEKRIGTAIGGEELAQATPEGQQVDEMMRKRDEAAKKKLDEIRKSLGH